MKIDRDDLFLLLTSHGIQPRVESLNGEYFERLIKFELFGVEYRIVWYSNFSTITVGGAHRNYILFDDARINTTWPSFREGLELLEDGRTVMMLTTKPLNWQMDDWKADEPTDKDDRRP